MFAAVSFVGCGLDKGKMSALSVSLDEGKGVGVNAQQPVPAAADGAPAEPISPGLPNAAGANEQNSRLLGQKQLLQGNISLLGNVSLDSDSLVTWRNPRTAWIVSGQPNKSLDGFELSDLSSQRQQFGPCRTLPKLSVDYSSSLLPVGTKTCWSIDAKRVIVVVHGQEPGSGDSTAFDVTNVPFAGLGTVFDRLPFSDFKIVGLSEQDLLLASAKHFVALNVAGGQLRMTHLDLSVLGLAGAPRSASRTFLDSKSEIKLVAAEGLFVATETRAASGSYLWQAYDIKLSADPDLDLTAEDLKMSAHKIRMLTEPVSGQDSRTRFFLVLNDRIGLLNLDLTSGPEEPSTASSPAIGFVNRYCPSCHAGPSPQGDLRLVLDDGSLDQGVLKEKKEVLLFRLRLPRPNALAMPPYGTLPSPQEISEFEQVLNGL
jgi:hypothetical protein